MEKLSDLKIGEMALIFGIDEACNKERRQRFLDLGFVKGAEIFIETISPLRDPVAYNLHDTLISLRREDAKMIYITKRNREE